MNSTLLQTKIAAVRSKLTGVTAGLGIAQVILFALVWLVVFGFFDWIIGFPLWIRAILLLILLAAIAGIVIYRIVRPIVYSPDDQQLALLVEHERPEFATRLIASVQLSQEGVIPAGISQSLVQAMIRQTEELAHPVEFGSVIKFDRAFKWLGSALIAFILVTALYFWGDPTTSALLQRAFLSNTKLPTKTRVEMVTGNQKVPIGEAVKITARALGIKPSAGTLYINYVSGRSTQFPMTRDEGGDSTYSYTLDSVQESFTYDVKLYDGRSDTFRIDALPRPAVTSIECFQVYPDYTSLGTVPRATGDLTLLMGSSLQVRVLANRPVRINPVDGKGCYAMRFTDEKTDKSAAVAMTVNPKDPRELTANLTLPSGTIGFSINLIDDDGIMSKDSAVYRIDMVADRPPTIRITSPDRKEILATGQSKIDVGFIAEDDYLMGKVTLKFKVDEGDVQSILLSIPPKERVIRGFYPWDIAKVAVPSGKVSLEGSVVEYWLSAEDTNNLSGPGKTDSEHYLARIVTRDEKKAELMARLGESLGVIRDVSENQECASSELGMLIQGAPPTPPGAPK